MVREPKLRGAMYNAVLGALQCVCSIILAGLLVVQLNQMSSKLTGSWLSSDSWNVIALLHLFAVSVAVVMLAVVVKITILS